MYGLILSLGLATTGGAADFHLRGGCSGLHARAGCTGAVQSAGCHGRATGCVGSYAGAGCHGNAQVASYSVRYRERGITPVAAVPAPAAIPAPVAPPVAPPAVMAGPPNVFVVPRAAPVRDFAFFTGERAHALFGRVRGACGAGGCR